MKLTRMQTKQMEEIEQLLKLDRRLKEDERLFVLEHYQEGATRDNAAMGAFFTPVWLARDFSLEVPYGCSTLVDLCAGIGSLSYACEEKANRIVCVERCEEYVRVGRKVMPDAEWIHADAFGDWIRKHGRFDVAISNPPFGNRVKSAAVGGRYQGGTFEYKVIELASRIADYGVFIVPQQSAPFRYSGSQRYERCPSVECQKFMSVTGIELEANCGIDTATYLKEWHGVAPLCEVVTCEFGQAPAEVYVSDAGRPGLQAPIDQLDLFATAA